MNEIELSAQGTKALIVPMKIFSQFESLVIQTIQKSLGVETLYAEYAYVGLALLAILMIGWLANLLVKRFLLGLVRSIAKKTRTKLSEYLLKESFSSMREKSTKWT